MARLGKANQNRGKAKWARQVSKALEHQHTCMNNGKSIVGFIYYFHPLLGFSWICFHMSPSSFFVLFINTIILGQYYFGFFRGLRGFFWCFLHRVWKKLPKYLHSRASIHGWQLGNITKKTHNQNIHFNFLQMFGVNSKSYPTSISTITPSTGPCLCRGIHLNNMCTSSKHTCSPM
jgi:hypothetical protein